MFVEAVGGWLANSLTLIADAGHMFLDAGALGFAWYAAHISHRSGNQTLSYGYHRAQVLAAFVNGLTLAALVLFILWEAISRFQNPEPMDALPALSIAITGLIVNIIAFYMLHSGEQNMNVRAATLHVLGDMLGSAAAIVAALTVYLTGWMYADPILAFIIALVLGRGAYRVINESAHILLEGAPEHLDIAEIRDGLYVTELIGHGGDLATGDYSRGAAGFWIENGEVAYPVNELTIASNLKDMFLALTPANDLIRRGAVNAPTLRVDGMTIAGQ